jgi:hypothetical protein
MSKKREKRIRETNKEYTEGRLVQAEQQELQARPNEALFTVDHTGSKAARKKQVKEQTRVDDNKSYSRVEQKLVAKIQEGSRKRSRVASKPKGKHNDALGDIWGTDSSGTAVAQEEDFESEFKNIATNQGNSKKKARIPQSSSSGKTSLLKVLPGQSYNPSVNAHQDALAEALALELRMAEEAARREEGDIKNEDGDSIDEEDGDDDDDEVRKSASSFPSFCSLWPSV